MLKNKLFAGAILALALFVVVGVNAASAESTVKVGSKGADVMTVQTAVGATADGIFGLMTKAKVQAFQASKGLTADGVVGPMTWMAIKANGAVSGNFPAGCTSAAGWSPISGVKCDATPSNPSTPSTGALTGGAGSIDITSTSTDVESKATESKDNVKVLGFKVEAQDSDIALTNLKVELKNVDVTSTPSSEKLTDYIDSVDVYMGSTKVGSADASDFSRDSGTPDVFSKSIALSNAVIKEGDKNTFYVEVSSGSVDTDDFTAEWNIRASTVRYQDATGIVLSEDVNASANTGTTAWTGTGAETFGYESSSANDLLTIKSSSGDPDAATIAVNASDSTKDQLIGAFKLKVDSDSSDIKINEIPVIITFADNGTTADDFADSVISKLNVKIDGTTYEADLATADDATLNGSGAATYRVDLNDSNVTIDAGDTVDVEIIADFNDQSGNYVDLTTVTASVATDTIDAEGADTLGTSEMSGSYSGNEQTLSLAAADVTGMKWVVNNTGSIVDFYFTVEANNDEDFVVLASSILDSATGTATITDTAGTPETTTKGILSKSTGDATAYSTTGFTVADGDTATFRVRYSLTTGTNGLYKEIKVTSVAGQAVPDATQVSPTATINVTS